MAEKVCVLVFQELFAEHMSLQSQRFPILRETVFNAQYRHVVWMNSYCAIVHHGVVVWAQDKHVSLNVWSLIWNTQRANMVAFCI